MQWLNLVSEDAGVQSLKAEARQPATTRGVDAVAPYPSAHPVRLGEGTDARQKPVQDRRQGERRAGGDRRKAQQAVLLDTRSQHNRRDIDNRRQTRSGGAEAKPSRTRINLYA
jgi:hypothetical protein